MASDGRQLKGVPDKAGKTSGNQATGYDKVQKVQISWGYVL
jgi:hypothetical protein